MIAPLIKWDHSQDWFVAEYDMNSTAITSERKITVELKSEDQKYMAGHIIDGEIDSFSNFRNFKMFFSIVFRSLFIAGNIILTFCSGDNCFHDTWSKFQWFRH